MFPRQGRWILKDENVVTVGGLSVSAPSDNRVVQFARLRQSHISSANVGIRFPISLYLTEKWVDVKLDNTNYR